MIHLVSHELNVNINCYLLFVGATWVRLALERFYEVTWNMGY